MSSIPLPLILGAITLAAMLALLLIGRKSAGAKRVEELAASQPPKGSTVKKENVVTSGVRKYVEQEEKKKALRERLIQAGFYSPDSAYWLNFIRAVAFLVPVALGGLVSLFTDVPPAMTLLIGSAIGLIGTLAPSFILDSRKAARQKKLRRSIPDALDVLSICLEGGMSFPASLSRVSQELVTAHPELALELAIVDRESRMGLSSGQAIRKFADRFDLEEIRSMATVVLQAETYGSSLVDAMNVFAESMREKRSQQAETKAQQAVIKIIFPTLLCIFPALFLVIMGPAAIQIYETLVVNGGK